MKSVKVTFKNECYFRGEYDGDDDWKLSGVGYTIQEAIDNIFKKEKIGNICSISIGSGDISLLETVEVDGKKYFSDQYIGIKNDSDLSELGFPAYVKQINSLYEYDTQCWSFAKNLFQNHPKKIHYKNLILRYNRWIKYFRDKENLEKERLLKIKKEEDERKLYLELQKKYG